MSASGSLSSLEPYRDWFGRDLDAVHADLAGLNDMVEKWQRVQNLVSRETVRAIWDRHILDSLQLLPLIFTSATEARGPMHVLDIGSGGGFPAIPLAIALKDSGVRFDLIESNGRKCAFLNAAIREFGLAGARVHNARIEAVDPEDVGEINIITSRALAPLPLLLRYALPFFGPNARAYFHKGREFREELQLADSSFAFDVVHHRSLIDPEGVILELTHLRAL
ncbi:16S rRNA (guanine(527)-N(7))-methyltransferase RsmG [Pelagibacterium xiamenense]|uniref:16S rRNA (guanine(527)-N(7))-methyltransferase RsmG n=1 Tax=Pelagibacterium xiamenense TaxID=2901140 RepID=UPI001E455DDF|nr:16S rRNA (guanine(527)-N(7))-methyltransferase RsmG [Pelagibacterium xiamenense]MCD7058422.1 16S rRNA (guanine(527)-N(7))-methyltransferase RsmG [Pelagibacterium xiamenense]